MKQITLRKLENEIMKNEIAVVHFGSSRCIPCRSQEQNLQKICSKYEKNGVSCYSVDIDNGKKGFGKLKNLGITSSPSIIPMTMIYVNGNVQNFTDSTLLEGNKTNKLYGERINIESAIQQAIQNFKNKK